MQIVGKIIVYIIVACGFVGLIANIKDSESELGKQFTNGVTAIGSCFIPIAGLMASLPYISAFIKTVLGPAFSKIGADPAIAAQIVIALDMGGTPLAMSLTDSVESVIMSMAVGTMAGATISFTIPVGLKMMNKKDMPYISLGILSGFLAIPFGVFFTVLLEMLTKTPVRSAITTVGDADYVLHYTMSQVLCNLIPVIVVSVLLAIAVFMFPNGAVKGFTIFGRVLDVSLKIVFFACVIQHFTGLFSYIFGSWGFDPIIADETDINRALEISGYSGLLLCGAFPMVYLMRKYLNPVFQKIGKAMHLTGEETAGVVAAMTSTLILFPMIEHIKPEAKVRTLAFAVCSSFIFGGQLSYLASYQPSIIFPSMVGKFLGGVVAIILANLLAIPNLKKLKV